MDYLIHVANVIYLFSYLVRDILWLRVLTVIAALTLCGYFLTFDLWPPIVWNGLFIAINGYHIRRLLLERRPVVLSEREQALYQLVFRTLTPREFRRLLAVGRWKAAGAGERLVEEGQRLDEVLVIARGAATVDSGERRIATLEDGALVGEMSLLSGRATSASVTASTETRYLAWPAEELRAFLRDNSELRAAWQYVVGRDLVAKLRAT